MLPDLINKIYTLSFEGLWLWAESLYDNMSIHVTSISNINNGDDKPMCCLNECKSSWLFVHNPVFI